MRFFPQIPLTYSPHAYRGPTYPRKILERTVTPIGWPFSGEQPTAAQCWRRRCRNTLNILKKNTIDRTPFWVTGVPEENVTREYVQDGPEILCYRQRYRVIQKILRHVFTLKLLKKNATYPSRLSGEWDGKVLNIFSNRQNFLNTQYMKSSGPRVL